MPSKIGGDVLELHIEKSKHRGKISKNLIVDVIKHATAVENEPVGRRYGG